jgi:hypothetical protein
MLSFFGLTAGWTERNAGHADAICLRSAMGERPSPVLRSPTLQFYTDLVYAWGRHLHLQRLRLAELLWRTTKYAY